MEGGRNSTVFPTPAFLHPHNHTFQREPVNTTIGTIADTKYKPTALQYILSTCSSSQMLISPLAKQPESSSNVFTILQWHAKPGANRFPHTGSLSRYQPSLPIQSHKKISEASSKNTAQRKSKGKTFALKSRWILQCRATRYKKKLARLNNIPLL